MSHLYVYDERIVPKRLSQAGCNYGPSGNQLLSHTHTLQCGQSNSWLQRQVKFEPPTEPYVTYVL